MVVTFTDPIYALFFTFKDGSNFQAVYPSLLGASLSLKQHLQDSTEREFEQDDAAAPVVVEEPPNKTLEELLKPFRELQPGEYRDLYIKFSDGSSVVLTHTLLGELD